MIFKKIGTIIAVFSFLDPLSSIISIQMLNYQYASSAIANEQIIPANNDDDPLDCSYTRQLEQGFDGQILQNYIFCQSKQNGLILEEIQINRGNCDAVLFEYDKKINFGAIAKIPIYCENPLEWSVVANGKKYTWTR